MPSFNEMTPLRLAQMHASHSMHTYAVLDAARITPMPHDEAVKKHGAEAIALIEETSWVDIRDGFIHVIDESVNHLKGFVS